jgi:hypothetical protein
MASPHLTRSAAHSVEQRHPSGGLVHTVTGDNGLSTILNNPLQLRLANHGSAPACRKNRHQQTDAYKGKRRAYMRGYYKLKISGKVK